MSRTLSVTSTKLALAAKVSGLWKMAGWEEEQSRRRNRELPESIHSGIWKLEPTSNSVFIDSVRVLNRNYTRFCISPSVYYSRFFNHARKIELEEKDEEDEQEKSRSSTNSRKRKRKQKKHYSLNDKELVAERRHQEARPSLVKAHQDLMGAKDVQEVLRELTSEWVAYECRDLSSSGAAAGHSFIEIGEVWQAPLYEITLKFGRTNGVDKAESDVIQYSEERIVPVFNNLVSNETKEDLEAEFLGSQYILPRESHFYMSDLGKIHDLIPADSDSGFNLILIDPPWENRSANQKSMYPTLPNRYFMSLPVKQLTHTKGALVALWLTNREKLWSFVEHELFPAWGVIYVATYYWLKVKSDGSLICDLDLFHHRPYECLLLGYASGKMDDCDHMEIANPLKDNKVVISIPGDYSRKPPVGDLLMEHIPGPRPGQCLELFAREMTAGWVSWGNEPLHFQESKYFTKQ